MDVTGSTAEVALDEEALKEAHGRRDEFVERANFHERERERAQRMARAEQAKINELGAVVPEAILDFDPIAAVDKVAGTAAGTLVRPAN